MKNVFFGLALYYEEGTNPSIAMGGDDSIVEVHESITDGDLNYRFGRRNKMSVDWSERSAKYGRGTQPCVALGDGQLVEVHCAIGDGDLHYQIGQDGDGALQWTEPVKYANGRSPSVATSAGGIVEVHQSSLDDTLWYNLGRFSDEGNAIAWRGNESLDAGIQPSVAVNARNQVVLVHGSQSSVDLYYRIGQVSEGRINWGQPIRYDIGSRARVALTENGDVIVVYQSRDGKSLMQRFGRIREAAIQWTGDARHFDDGIHPTVACAGDMAIQAHKSENNDRLWASTSRITDRSRWMQNHIDIIGGIPLYQLTTGASHDAGMYQHGLLASLGKTQNLNLYEQLSNGIRYFDLRPKWDGSQSHVHHGGISGPALSDIIADVRRFMSEGNRELVILKFSHYANFSDLAYEELVWLVQSNLREWLFRDLPSDARLAELRLRTLIGDNGGVLVVCDDDYPIRFPASGVWVYRDSDSPTAALGDLRVYDKYSNVLIYDKMRTDQIGKFEAYDGRCVDKPEIACDQFLLSWTLTPPTAVWQVSKEANRHLGAAMAAIPRKNQYGEVINYLYVDYSEYSRATDVAMSMNEIP